MIWPASRDLGGSIALLEAWETQSGVIFIQDVVIVCLHTHHLDPTVDISVLPTRCKRVVGIDLSVRLKATLSFAFPLLSNAIDRRTAGCGMYFRLQHMWRSLRLRVCEVFIVFDVGKLVQVFDWSYHIVEFTT